MSSKDESPVIPTFNIPERSTIKLPCLWFRWLILALLTLLGYAYGQYDTLKSQQTAIRSEIKNNGKTLTQMVELSKQVNGQAIDIAEIKRDVSALQRDVSSLADGLKDQGKDIKELLQRTPPTSGH